VQKIVADHNHYLASPNKMYKLRSQRHVIEVDRQLIAQNMGSQDEVGASV
jgi:hypothetical protein